MPSKRDDLRIFGIDQLICILLACGRCLIEACFDGTHGTGCPAVSTKCYYCRKHYGPHSPAEDVQDWQCPPPRLRGAVRRPGRARHLRGRSFGEACFCFKRCSVRHVGAAEHALLLLEDCTAEHTRRTAVAKIPFTALTNVSVRKADPEVALEARRPAASAAPRDLAHLLRICGHVHGASLARLLRRKSTVLRDFCIVS